MNVPIVWIMGPPSSGKGTQAEKIVAKYGFTHIDPNAIVDREIAAKSEIGKKFEDLRKEENVVPLLDIMSLVEKQIMGQRGGVKGFIIDGYPQNSSEAKLLEQRIGPPDMIISLEMEQETFDMRRPASAGASRNSSGQPPVSLNSYNKNVKPVLEQYADKTMRFDGGRDADEIFQEMVPNLDILVNNRGNQITIER